MKEKSQSQLTKNDAILSGLIIHNSAKIEALADLVGRLIAQVENRPLEKVFAEIQEQFRENVEQWFLDLEQRNPGLAAQLDRRPDFPDADA